MCKITIEKIGGVSKSFRFPSKYYEKIENQAVVEIKEGTPQPFIEYKVKGEGIYAFNKRSK